MYVLAGDEEFLRRQARASLEASLLEGSDPEFAVGVYEGETAQFSTVKSELDTAPFLSPRRVVVVEQADPFVSEFRSQLERLVEQPSKGVLILEVKSWPSNTRLAKALPNEATILCKALSPQRLPGWCVDRAAIFGKKLSRDASEMLVEFVGNSLGVLDQELAKVASYVGDRTAISNEDVDHLVGRSREAETFRIFESIGNGRTAEAVAILHRLFQQGEDAHRILGAFTWQLRRLAQAARLVKLGTPVTTALLEVGVREFALRNWDQLMKHLGWNRLDQLYDWLLEVDLGIKGNTPIPDMFQLERLVVRLAQPRTNAPRPITAS